MCNSMQSGAVVSLFMLLLLFNYLTQALPTAELLSGQQSTPSYVLRHEQRGQVDKIALGTHRSTNPAVLRITSSISRRWDKHVLGSWEVIYEHVSVFLPPQAVAPILAEFYREMIRNTVFDWIMERPTGHLLLRRGSIELEFWTPTGVVPWYFVHDLGELLLNWNVLGYVGRFNAVFLNAQLDEKIVVTMRLLEVAATT